MINGLKSYLRCWKLSKRFPDSRVYQGASVDDASVIGKYVVLFQNVILQNTTVAEHSYIQKNTTLLNTQVGRFCSIAQDVCIGPINHPINMVSTSPVFYDKDQPLPFFYVDHDDFRVDEAIFTVIEADVWIGQGAMIMPGVTVGVGAVIGAGSIVTKNVEPYSVSAGVPARHIKWRFSETTREGLINSQWWTFNEEKLASLSPVFNEPNAFLKKLISGKK
jgi:acetyltransferase-like isoleucine patch superfamily enzyme